MTFGRILSPRARRRFRPQEPPLNRPVPHALPFGFGGDKVWAVKDARPTRYRRVATRSWRPGTHSFLEAMD